MNFNESPTFSLLDAQNPAHPSVKEQNVCFPQVFVAVFTLHGDNGPASVYVIPSKPSTPWMRQYRAGTSCAHNDR